MATTTNEALNEIRATVEIFRDWMAGIAKAEDVAAQFVTAEAAMNAAPVPSKVSPFSGRVYMTRNQKSLSNWRNGGFAEFREQFEEYAA